MFDRKYSRLNAFTMILAIIIAAFAFAATVNGREPFRADKPLDCYDQDVLRGGEGSYGFVPSWFVMVKVESRHYTDYGSGAFITDRIILTCYHNVRGGGDIDVKNGTGSEFKNVKILLQSPKLDLCLLYVGDDSIPYHKSLRVSMDNFTPKGTVHACGYNPQDDAVCRYEGKLTGKSYSERGLKGAVTHGHTAKVVQGMSGGPLLDAYGQIVGVNVSSGTDGESLAVNLKRIQWFLDQYHGFDREK